MTGTGGGGWWMVDGGRAILGHDWAGCGAFAGEAIWELEIRSPIYLCK